MRSNQQNRKKLVECIFLEVKKKVYLRRREGGEVFVVQYGKGQYDIGDFSESSLGLGRCGVGVVVDWVSREEVCVM